jgi:hypothetical protein
MKLSELPFKRESVCVYHATFHLRPSKLLRLLWPQIMKELTGVKYLTSTRCGDGGTSIPRMTSKRKARTHDHARS